MHDSHLNFTLWSINLDPYIRNGRKIAAFEMHAYGRLLQISYLDHITNESIRKRIEEIIGKHEFFINTIRKRKLQWFGQVCRQNDTLAKYILQGKVEGAENKADLERTGLPRFWTGRVSLWRKQQESRAIGRHGGLWSIIRWCSHDQTRV